MHRDKLSTPSQSGQCVRECRAPQDAEQKYILLFSPCSFGRPDNAPPRCLEEFYSSNVICSLFLFFFFMPFRLFVTSLRVKNTYVQVYTKSGWRVRMYVKKNTCLLNISSPQARVCPITIIILYTYHSRQDYYYFFFHIKKRFERSIEKIAYRVNASVYK